ncbi:MAG: hypothetical protein A2583_11980 [Bdellovibrionales bacterium RIFOXYD1_FULL_53_11]|nr:MAG: hypothetical protein A2583_11980 [Bdellovibrionales bacterium RIFOXYD1_FULL_53_11]
MILSEETTYYDLLEVAPDATPQELRAAYLRAKSAYKKDSVALYTLISEEETEEYLRRIEEAYNILSSPERRKSYDRNHGILKTDDGFATDPVRPPHRPQKIISIDRVPPMDHSGGEQDILVAPTTDFTAPAAPVAQLQAFSSQPQPLPLQRRPDPATDPLAQQPRHSSDPRNDQLLRDEILQETEWRGGFLRKIREARRVSLEELSENTKITRTYISAIEEEGFSKLPAPVYLRGFIVQIAKFLKLPHDKVAAAYLARYTQEYNKDRG